MAKALQRYVAKRNFDVTPEPSGKEPRRASEHLRFMVHKHDANRLHYDIRLEMSGVLASWACPKGPSYDPAQKRLAVETEDHPLAYADFEGRIPDGEYGAGDALIWDQGTYDTVPPGQAELQRRKGHLHLQLEGQKLKGGWHLVRTRTEGKRQNWLCFKAKDGTEQPDYDVEEKRPESVKSGRRVTRGPVRKSTLRAVHPKAESLVMKIASPMLATLAEEGSAPESQFLYEVKYDGYRAIAARSGNEVAVVSRNQLDLTTRFSFLIPALRSVVTGEALIDGEVVAFDEHGISRFGLLGEANVPHRFVVFDLLWLEGQDLRLRPLEERRELLSSLVANADERIVLAERIEGSERSAIDTARSRGLEGLVAKRLGSVYRAVRSQDWRKLKVSGNAELVIAGFTQISSGRAEIGALYLATRKGQRWVYAGKVGTGFDQPMRKRLWKLLEADEVEMAQIDRAPRVRKARWVKPRHLAQLAFTEWTRDGRLRHPVFQGLREDKPATEVQVEVPLTHGTKVLFPQSRLTKADVREYVEAVAEVMLPALQARPLSFQQWPQGIGEPGFYRQHAASAPKWVQRATVEHDERTVEHLVVQGREDLLWLANQSALTLHIPACRLGSLEEADWVAFDFDPAGDSITDTVEPALALKGLLEELKLKSVPKTSGKRGLHVFVPLAPGHRHDEVHDFAAAVCGALARRFAGQVTTERMKKNRHGRLYLDADQNGRLKTMVSPYSIRAVEGAPVSAPLAWGEVGPHLRAADFTIKTMPERINKLGDLFAAALVTPQHLPKLKERKE
ncbi:MAG: DNA ligase D [Myxococcaceae bacterium]|nr:DNA ligase D [Myxococcaceae bacterium]